MQPLDRITVTDTDDRLVELGGGAFYADTQRIIIPKSPDAWLPDWDVIGAEIIGSNGAEAVGYPVDMSGPTDCVEVVGIITDLERDDGVAGQPRTAIDINYPGFVAP